ncbi:MAG: isopenicillin N synthase family dioxygenase [Alphaproteobacteria bacterium]
MTTTLDDSVKGKKVDFDSIPVIDIATLVDGSDIDSVAKELRHVCENVGFLYVKNHGISDDTINDMLKLTREFFDLPVSVKNNIHIKDSGTTLRGYIGMYEENVDPEKTKDYKECYDMGANSDDSIPFFGMNRFPDAELPEFGKVATAYHDAMLKLGKSLSQGIAVSLGLEKDFFDDRLSDPITIQRFLHYPPQTGKIDESKMGIGAHTDYGFLTILYQDDIGGLQVQNHSGEWVSAPPIPGTFVINMGDLLQTLTGGRFVSTMHRVINASGKERYSMPFFMDMNFNAEVKVVPTCENIAVEKVEPYKCGHHKFSRFVDSFPHLEGIDVKATLDAVPE